MDMTGERRIPAPRQKVWDALNDPEVLKACIPGCETWERTSDTDLKATAAVKIGPIAARFNGTEDNVVLWTFNDGKRSFVKRGTENYPLELGTWHELKTSVRGTSRSRK